MTLEAVLYPGCAVQVLAGMPDASVDLVLTDPPYRTISGGSGPSIPIHRRPAGMLAKNDGRIFEHNAVGFAEYLPHVFRVLKDRSHLYLMVNFLNLETALLEVRRAGFRVHNLLVWQKNNATPNRWYMKNVEYVIFARKGAAKAIHDKGSKTCHAFDNVRGKSHPTEKPVGLLQMYIENSSCAGDTVFDPFMGTGSTGVAALRARRNFIGVEIDKAYFDVACRRVDVELGIR